MDNQYRLSRNSQNAIIKEVIDFCAKSAPAKNREKYHSMIMEICETLESTGAIYSCTISNITTMNAGDMYCLVSNTSSMFVFIML